MNTKFLRQGTALGTSLMIWAFASTATAEIVLSNGATLDIYGYVKADLIYDIDTDLGTTIFGLASIDQTSEDDDSFRGQAIQSRLGFDYNQGTEIGDLHVNIEGDFFGGGGDGGSFRLRHAYGELNGVLAGQTWSNFMPIESYPSTLDFQGPAGIPFTRVTQLRYTIDGGNGSQFSTSIEERAGPERDPAFTGAYSYTGDNYFLKGAFIYSEVDGETTSGINVSGNAQLWEGGNIQASYTYGEGMESYFVFGGDDFDAAGDAIESYGVTLAVSQAVTDKMTIGLAYGYREIDSFSTSVNDTEELETVHLTLTYSPLDNVTYGIEYITGERTEFDGDSFDADRIQTSVQYTF